ncbi:MAG: hypothetical protein ACK4VP_09275, partial [Nitrospira sp.]
MNRVIAAVFCCVVMGSEIESVLAGDSIAEKIERERKTLERLKGTIEEKRKRAYEAEKKRESLLQSMQSLDEQLIRRRQDYQDILRKLRKKDREIQQITEQIGI